MRKFLVLAGILVLFTFFVEGFDEKLDAEPSEDDPFEPEENDEEDSVFAHVETAAMKAEITVNKMKQALSELLERSVIAMESTEQLLKSGAHSVKSIASGAAAAAKQLGVGSNEPPQPPTILQKPAPVEKPQQPKSRGWFGW